MDDKELLGRFERCAISRAEWTHRAHVQVAYLYISTLPFDAAIDRIRCGIKALNGANKVEEGPRSGYNETITVAFARLVLSTFRTYETGYPPTSDEFCDRHPELMSPQVLKLFYSPLRLANPLTKAEFLEPDLAQLPTLD
jgi:hypothetical protein